MTPQETLASFERVAQTWIDAIDSYSDEQFGRKPSEEEWSIGQVYSHLTRAAAHFQLHNAEHCIAGTASRTEEGFNERGESVFQRGGFAPVKIKPPMQIPGVQPENDTKDGVRAGLESLVIRMRQLAPLVASADPARKTQHPGFGMMNAGHWYSLVEMHFRHHLLQKGRIDEWLGIAQPAESAAE
jgi:hypothetical protein